MELLVQDLIESFRSDGYECTEHGPCTNVYIQLTADLSLDTLQVAWTRKTLEETLSDDILLLISEKFVASFTGCQIVVDDARLAFSRIIQLITVTKKESYIHPTAVIDPRAEIGFGVTIGANTVIGRCKVGDRSFIDANVTIGDDVEIGSDCNIYAQVALGVEGSGYAYDKDERPIPFPQIGKLIIGDFVDVGAQSYVCKGSLSVTRIHDHAKIGLSACIGHNVEVNENTIILANAVLAGGSKIGKNVYIGIGSTVRNKVVIGDRSTIGMGAVVVKDVPANSTVIGNPAKPI